MKKEGVNAAFDLLLDAMTEVIEECQLESSKKTRSGRYDEAKEDVDVCETLTVFRNDISDFRDRNLRTVILALAVFRNDISDFRDRWLTEFGRRADTKPPSPRPSGEPGPRISNKLVVTFPETGERLDNPIAIENFAEALRLMSVEKVADLEKQWSGEDLISKHQKQDKRGHPRKEVDGYYVVTHIGNKAKKKLLEEIAHRLGIKIGVQCVPRHKT